MLALISAANSTCFAVVLNERSGDVGLYFTYSSWECISGTNMTARFGNSKFPLLSLFLPNLGKFDTHQLLKMEENQSTPQKNKHRLTKISGNYHMLWAVMRDSSRFGRLLCKLEIPILQCTSIVFMLFRSVLYRTEKDIQFVLYLGIANLVACTG